MAKHLTTSLDSSTKFNRNEQLIISLSSSHNSIDAFKDEIKDIYK